MANVKKLHQILADGLFEELIGMEEDDQLEFKDGPYRLHEEYQKTELAKDASAMANGGGGVIILGVRAEKESMGRVERAGETRPFDRSLFDASQIRDVLRSRVYPPMSRVETDWHPTTQDPERGVASVWVPGLTQAESPYIVVKIAEPAGRVHGSYVAYFQRAESSAEPELPERLHGWIRLGMHASDGDQRLAAIEQRLGAIEHSLLDRVPAAEPQPGPADASGRVRQAINAAGLDKGPVFWLATWPLQGTRFDTLFRSRDAGPVRLLENPPRHRRGGFDLQTGRGAEIVEGSRRRCIAPRWKVLELSQDGVLVFAADGGERHLSWGMRSDTDTGLRINNIALAETVYLFAELAAQMFGLASPAPEALCMEFGFSAMRLGAHLAALSCARPSEMTLDEGWRTAPRDGWSVSLEKFPVRDVPPGVAAYNLLSKLYVWFGFEEDEMPYVAPDSGPRRIEYELIVGNPLRQQTPGQA